MQSRRGQREESITTAPERFEHVVTLASRRLKSPCPSYCCTSWRAHRTLRGASLSQLARQLLGRRRPKGVESLGAREHLLAIGQINAADAVQVAVPAAEKVVLLAVRDFGLHRPWHHVCCTRSCRSQIGRHCY